MNLDFVEGCRVCRLILRADESCAQDYFDCLDNDGSSIYRKMANDRYVRRSSRHKIMALAYAHSHLRQGIEGFLWDEIVKAQAPRPTRVIFLI